MQLRVATALVLVALAGCGGGGSPAPKGERHSGGGGEEADRADAVRGLPPGDRAAFFQVATATGTLRHWASKVVLGRPAGAEREAVHAAADRLGSVRPRDRALRAARRQALSALRAALAAGGGDRTSARRALGRAERLAAAIDRVVRNDPRYSALVPD